MQAEKFKNLTMLSSFIMALFFITSSGAVEKGSNANKDHKILNFGSACINAYWPIDGSTFPSADIITSPFGIRYVANDNYDFHEGIDIRAQTPRPVYAFTDGYVELVVDDGNQNTNNFIILEHTDPCDGDVFYTSYHHLSSTNVIEDDYVPAGAEIATSGISGATNYHLHFAALVGGINALNDAINPMRDDSLPYNNTAPADILIMDSEDISNYDIAFQILTPENDVDLNTIEVTAFLITGEQEDYFFMNLDTREGIDSEFHCPGQTCENGDEDGYVVETTEQKGLTVDYQLRSYDYTPSPNQDFHVVQVDLDEPTNWGIVNELRIKATDTQNASLEHRVFIDD